MDPILCIELYLATKAVAYMEGYMHGRQIDMLKC